MTTLPVSDRALAHADETIVALLPVVGLAPEFREALARSFDRFGREADQYTADRVAVLEALLSRAVPMIADSGPITNAGKWHLDVRAALKGSSDV